MKAFNKNPAALFLLLLFNCHGFAQNRYALLIGINHYLPPEGYHPVNTMGRKDFRDLEGCLNDVQAINSIIGSRFGFTKTNTTLLLDEKASREGILTAMNGLFEKAKAGDIVFIYYSGHGSRVHNSFSRTKSYLMDETIVPSDTWKENVYDIRDKELSKIFNAFITKKIKLTVIFDCCHSGSISRGPNITAGKMRYMPEADWDSKDSSLQMVPENRPGDNFLIFSAARADENAIEQQELEDSADYVCHGAFTMALCQAFKQEPAGVSAQGLFVAARAILKNNGASQEPVIGGSDVRKLETLIGCEKSSLPDYSYIPVERKKEGKIILSGGWALGIYPGNELSMMDNKNTTDTIFKLRVTKVTGISQSEAIVISGDESKIQPGFLFEVTNWASSSAPLLSIYVSTSSYSKEEVDKFALVADQLKRNNTIRWLDNCISKSPYTTVFFANGKSYIKIDQEEPKELATVTSASILAQCKKGATFYMELPVSKDTLVNFKRILSANHNLRITESAAQANYCFFGILGKNGKPAYGFRKVNINASDSLESMPLVTDCYELQHNTSRSVGDSLAMLAIKLSKLRGWLNIVSTPEVTKNTFPFHLSVFDEEKKKTITNSYRIGDSISFSINTDSNFAHYQTGLQPKYVYVFGIDQAGRMELYYPLFTDNGENKFPQFRYNQSLIDTVPTKLSYRVGAPSGTDNFLLLASDLPILNPKKIFRQAPVYNGMVSRGAEKPPDTDPNPLTRLLQLGNTNELSMRGDTRLPGNWVLKKYSIKCTW